MKRTFLMLTLVFSLISISSSANEINVAEPVLKSFNNSFKNATDVNWTTTEHFYKVNFSLNDEYVAVYYNQEGQIIAMTRNIVSKQLPLALQVALKNNYAQFWISDLFEITNEEGTAYYVTLENADTKMIMKSNSESVWSVYKKSSK